jgi:hypothetical protein
MLPFSDSASSQLQCAVRLRSITFDEDVLHWVVVSFNSGVTTLQGVNVCRHDNVLEQANTWDIHRINFLVSACCRANYSVVMTAPCTDACHCTQARTYVTYHSVGLQGYCPRSCVTTAGDNILLFLLLYYYYYFDTITHIMFSMNLDESVLEDRHIWTRNLKTNE